MRKSVRRRHNKDGSITTTKTYSYKNVFGTRVVDTYSERSAPKIKKKSAEIKASNAAAIAIAFFLFFFLWIFGIELSWNATLLKIISILIVVLFVTFMLINNILPLKVLVLDLFRKNKKVDIESPENEVKNVMRPIDKEDFDIIDQAAELFINEGGVSLSHLQRKLKLGYARAARVMDELEELGVVSPSNGTGLRSLLVTKEMWEHRKTLH